MNPKVRLLSLAAAFAVSALLNHAQTWNTANGAVEGKFAGIYGSTIHIVGKKTATTLPLYTLDDAGIDAVAQHLTTPAPTPKWAESTSPMAKALKGRLYVRGDEKFTLFEPGDRPEPELYVVFFASRASGKCRTLTPKLVKLYETLRERGLGGRIELVHVSSDKEKPEYQAFVNEAQIPWLLLKHGAIIGILDKWKGKDIPCLAVMNREGDIVFHSYEGGRYDGSERPMADLLALFADDKDQPPEVRAGRHRLAVRQHLLANASNSVPAKACATPINRDRYQGLDMPTIRVVCSLNASGKVDSYTTDPMIDCIYDTQLHNDMKQWLFLPAIENGNPRSDTVTVTLELQTPPPAPPAN